MLVTMSMTLRMANLPGLCHFPKLTDHELYHTNTIYVKILYIFLVWFFIKQVCSGDQSKKDAMLHSHYLSSRYSMRHCSSKFCLLLIGICYWSFLINFLVITIVNPSLLNPGPIQNISVAYQNVQGLIPFSQLDNEHPTLDTTKIFELNSYM